ncbi:RNA-dependent RNA polymerase RDP-1 [Diaporthe amygdali]|uniref:RNA-dependent RNA polymerase RDP-1 n=1 Tax=Phomopsis amygdali TaxID=1214568 RepID=UPI0022FE460C|nr:RNA-dependent RNA polymerase RDP-1 [Diaporthe amygdali]KAJ0123196.1 RNA-dependent RNA polymerase RDP-1 [Diaporthe amygdali]
MSSHDRHPTSPSRGPSTEYGNSTLTHNTRTASVPHVNGDDGNARNSALHRSPTTGHGADLIHPKPQPSGTLTPSRPLGTTNMSNGNAKGQNSGSFGSHQGRSVQPHVPARTSDPRGLLPSRQNRFVPLRGHQRPSQRPQQRGTPAPLTGANLSAAQSLTIDMFGLPTDIKIKEIWESLTADHLSINRIEIYENDDGKRNGKVRVMIEPPPSRWPTWSGPDDSIPINRADSSNLRVSFEARPYFSNSIRTPCNRYIPPKFCRKEFLPTKLMFGMMASESTMLNLPQFSYEDIVMLTKFSKRQFEIQFKVNVGRYGRKVFKMQIDFSHPTKIVWGTRNNGAWALAMHLPNPPKLYGLLPVSHDDEQSLWQEWDLWARQTDISSQMHRLKHLPARLEKQAGQSVEFGRWTTYYLEMDTSQTEWESVRTYLEDYNVKIIQVDQFDLVSPGASNVWKLLDYSAEMTLELLSSTNTYHLDFPVRYQLEVCISHGLINEYSVDAQFLEKLNSFDTDRAKMMLEGVAEANRQFYEPMRIFDEPRILHYCPNARIPPYATLVRRAVITPTTIYFKTPCVELTNRILRKYSDLTDRFLRVQFTDEMAFGKIFSSQDSNKDDNLYTRVHRVMRNGVIIGDRHYQFLAFSNSQFRENGAFLFCETDHVTCASIRNWMGDFRHIHSVGKFAARMGQCFTTTRQVNGISIPKLRQINDIQRRTGDNIWNFTDGVGKISNFFAKMIASERDLPETPSCFQMRMGGCKGVVVVWPDVPASEVHIRPSQEKFKAIYNGLEIIKTSVFSHATLNKQVIPVLVALGVDQAVFVSMLDDELKEYEEAMADSMKAGELLRSQVDENQTTLTMAEMVDTFMDSEEPFLWTLLRLWKCWVLKRLKHKFAISVKNSAMIFGVVDEIGVLRGHSQAIEGKGYNRIESLPQIFVQVPIEGTDGKHTTNYEVITGLCVVGRNPSLHPGDVRVVEAVDVPELRHLKNVVVFPKTGDRDIPSMCSGGDMDGDDYFVYWDQRLIPKEWDHPPLDHDAESSTPGLDKPQDVKIADVTRFFAQYMKNDSLGRIATAHFAQADQLPGGVKHPKCIELAKLHSKAVDYIKSGKPAVMQRRLQPRKWPHWMERDKSSYRSTSALGQIYDRIKIEEFHAAYEKSFDTRILSRYQLEEEILTKASEIKAAYDIAMRRLMGQHEAPVTEFEIWSTFILSKPRVGSDYKLQENVGREVDALKARFRAMCMEAVAGKEQTQTFAFANSMINLEKLDRFVAAMYIVTHNEVRAAVRERSTPKPDADGKLEEIQMPLISFPWLFHRELARVALGRGGEVRALRKSTWMNRDDSQHGQQTDDEELVADRTEIEMPDNALLPRGIGLEGDTQQLLQDVRPEKGGNATERGAVSEDGETGEDYVRTSSGQVVHRGQMLTVFTNAGEEVQGQHSANPAISTGDRPGAQAAFDSSNGSLVEDDSPGSSYPASPMSEHGSHDEAEEVEFEEVDGAHYGEDEDALEALARKIGM